VGERRRSRPALPARHEGRPAYGERQQHGAKGTSSRWSGPRGRRWGLRRRPAACPGKTRSRKRRS